MFRSMMTTFLSCHYRDVVLLLLLLLLLLLPFDRGSRGAQPVSGVGWLWR